MVLVLLFRLSSIIAVPALRWDVKYLLIWVIPPICFPLLYWALIVQFTALKTMSKVQVALSSAESDLQSVADNLHVAAASAVVGVGLSCFLL